MKHLNGSISLRRFVLALMPALWLAAICPGQVLAQGAAADVNKAAPSSSDERRERFERLPPEQQVQYLRGLPPDMRRDLGRQLSPETRARIRDQILDERMQRLERQAERQAQKQGGSGEAGGRQLSAQERQQLREQVNESRRQRTETQNTGSGRKPHEPQEKGR